MIPLFKNRSRSFLPTVLSFVSLSMLSQAQDVVWNGNTSSIWGVGSNWDGGEIPADSDNAIINSGSVDYGEASGSTEVLRAVELFGGTLNISGGEIFAFKRSNVASILNGTVHQTGGLLDLNAVQIAQEVGNNSFFFLSGGEFVVGREVSDFSMFLGANRGGDDAGTGSFEISGGSLSTRAGVKLGDATSSGIGNFAVLGSSPEGITIAQDGGDKEGGWLQNAGSTLQVGIDFGGVTPIFLNDGSDTAEGASATFEAGSLLDVDYHNISEGGGTWTVMEVENGEIIDNGLSFAPGVDTSIWSFTVDNSGANGRLLVSATGDPIGHAITIGNTLQQKMRFGMDYERLWFWTGGLNGSERDDIARWSAVDSDIDYIRVAINSGYELNEGEFDLSAYTNRIIPMMQEMKQANPNIKFFASPRPLEEAQNNVAWQPYPQWVTRTTGNNTNYNLNNEKCADYLERYILLMKSYDFKISFLDLTNEWDTSGRGGGAMSSGDVRDITEDLKSRLDPEDMPLIIAPSAFSYAQGDSWINSVNTTRRREAIDIASSHNTGRSGDAKDFAENVRSTLGDDVEIWNTEVHGWKSTSGVNETTSFYYYLEAVRAGFGGLNGWLALGTTNQGHAYILNPSGTPVRNVKYYIFRKLSSTSNYGYALDILEEPNASIIANTSDDYDSERNVTAFIKGNLMTVWVINEHETPLPVVITPSGHTIGESSVRRTRWTDANDVEGFETFEPVTSNTAVTSTIPGESVCCFEIVLGTENFDTTRIEVEDFSHQWGLGTEASGDVDGGDNICHTNNGDWLRYGAVALTGDSTVSLRVARPSGRPDSKIEIREGSADGPVLGEVTVPVTGDWQDYQTVETDLNVDAGIYNLYLRFVEDAENPSNNFLVNVNWFSVNEAIVVPLPVTGLTATTAGSSQINLTWDSVLDADRYNVKRSTTNAGPFTLVASNLSGTSYSDSGLSAGQEYYYVVSAVQADVEGPDSAAISGITTIAAPTNLVATVAGENAIDLTWNATPGATGYRIQRSTTSGGPYTEVTITTGALSYRDTGLTPGTRYYYIVEGGNSNGVSPLSVEANALPFQAITEENLVVASFTVTELEGGEQSLSLTMAQSGQGQFYQVMSTEDLANPIWQAVSPILTGNGGALNFSFEVDTDAISKQFFRVRVWTP